MSDNVSANELVMFIERVEGLTEEKQVIQDYIKDVYAEARGRGYDASIMREIIRLRKMKPDERAEHEAVLQVYLDALGMA